MAGRYAKRHLDTMGTFVNILIARIEFDKNLSFSALCQYVKSQLTASYRFQEIPYDEIAYHLNRKIVHLPMISMQNMQCFESSWVRTHYIEDMVESFDILMSIAEWGQKQRGELIVSLKYNTNVLTQNTATSMIKECEKLLSMVTGLPNIFLR